MNFYLAISTIVFLCFGIIWRRGDFLNIAIKLMFIVLSIAGCFFFFHNMGFIIQQNVGDMRLY